MSESQNDNPGITGQNEFPVQPTHQPKNQPNQQGLYRFQSRESGNSFTHEPSGQLGGFVMLGGWVASAVRAVAPRSGAPCPLHACASILFLNTY